MAVPNDTVAADFNAGTATYRTTDLACRVYVTRNGLAGLPTVEQIVEALETRMLR